MAHAAVSATTAAAVTTVVSGGDAGIANTASAQKCASAGARANPPDDAPPRTEHALRCQPATRRHGTAPAAATPTEAAAVSDAKNGDETGIANTASAARRAKTQAPVPQPDCERSKLIQRDIEPCAPKRTRQRGSVERSALPSRSLRMMLACGSTGNAPKCAPNDASTCNAPK